MPQPGMYTLNEFKGLVGTKKVKVLCRVDDPDAFSEYGHTYKYVPAPLDCLVCGEDCSDHSTSAQEVCEGCLCKARDHGLVD